MLSPVIPLGQWLPDFADTDNPGVITATNVIPEVDGYGPFKSLVEVSDDLGAECIGAKAVLSSSGVVYTFAGTATGLYLYDVGSWIDITRTTGGAYASVAGDFWDFIAYGDRVIATNYTDDVQTYLIGTDTDFSQLSATAPRCKRLGIIGEFVFMADTYDTIDDAVGNRVWWSPLGNPTGVWASSQATQCDFQDLAQDSSPAVAIIGSQEVGVVVKGLSLYRLQYVGPPLVFDIQMIEQERGSKFPLSCIGDSHNIYYHSGDGFYLYDGNHSNAIGQGRIDKYFQDNFDVAYGHRLQAAIDKVNKIVAWAFPGPGNTNGRPNFILLYSWAFDKWSIIEKEVQVLIKSFGDDLTLEEIGAIYATLEEVPFSLDSAAWKSNSALLGAFSVDNKMGLFDGANMDATIITTDIQLNPAGKAYVSAVEPLIDYEDDLTVQVGHRTLQKTIITYTVAETLFSETGRASFDIEDKFHRAKFNLSGDNWSRFKSFKVEYEETAYA